LVPNRLDFSLQQQVRIESDGRGGSQFSNEFCAIRPRGYDRFSRLNRCPPTKVHVGTIGEVQPHDMHDGFLKCSKRLEEPNDRRNNLTRPWDLSRRTGQREVVLDVNRDEGR